MYHVTIEFLPNYPLFDRETVLDDLRGMFDFNPNDDCGPDENWVDRGQLDCLSCHITKQLLPDFVEWYTRWPEALDRTIIKPMGGNTD